MEKDNLFKNIDYDNCITNITSSIQKFYHLKPNYKTNEQLDRILSEKDYDNVVLLILDGCGNAIIDKNTTENHFLRTHRIGTFKSTYPPTTANCTTAYLSGLNPITTNWLGWSTYYNDLNLGVDNFHNKETMSKELVAGENIAYRKMPFTHMGEIISKNSDKNVSYYTVFPHFVNGGCKSLKEFEHRICKLCNQIGKKYIYAYWDDPDKTMHLEGTNTLNVKKILNSVSKMLHRIERKTKNTLVIVSADHGQIDVVPIALYTYYDLMGCLKGPITCDARTAFFFVKDEKKEEFVRLFKKYFDGMYELFTKDEIINKHIFGYGDENPLYRQTIGDFIAIAKANYFFLISPKSQILKGHHSGPTIDEMSIPLIIIKN